MTKQKLLSAEGPELSRLLGEVLQGETHGHVAGQSLEEMRFSYFHCTVCGQINFEPDSHCKATRPIPLTPAEAFKWRDWAVEKYGAFAFIRGLNDTIPCSGRRGLNRVEYIVAEAQPEHYLKAAALCVIKEQDNEASR